MRRKAIKLREYNLGGAKANSTCISNSISPYFVVGDSHNNIRLYAFDTQEEISIYNASTGNNVQTEVTAVALSCTEKEICSGTNRGIIHIWDMESAKAHTLLKGHPTSVNCFGIYPQQPSKLASGSYDTMIKLWDIRQKNNVATLKGHTKPINSLSISPDGNLLLSGSEDNTARLWELRYPDKPLYTASQHNGPVLKAKFNPQDCMFATCSMDKTAKYFRCEQKRFGFQCSTQMVATAVTAIGFDDEDGKKLFTAANDVLKCWNMNKNAMLMETFDTNWKGVQEIMMVKGSIMAVAFNLGNLSVWVCDAQKRSKNSSQLEGDSFVLPKINKGVKFGDQFQINELQNIVGMAVQKVNTIEDRPVRDNDKRTEQFQKKKLQIQKRKEIAEKKKQQQQKKRIQIERLKAEREAKDKQQRQRLRAIKEAKQKQDLEQRKRKQQQRKKIQEERQEKLYKERLQRQKQIQQRVKQTFQNNQNLQGTFVHDVLENSSLMNISTFVVDGYQKQKMKQIQMIGDIMKDSIKYQQIMSDRESQLKPILNYWKQGKIGISLELIVTAHYAIKIDFTTAILTTPRFKSSITPQVAITLTSILRELLSNQKHSIHIFIVLTNLNYVVLMFKEQLIKIKTFNPLTRVDLSRQERLAKYDKLIDQFLSVFKQQRLKRYYESYKKGDKDEKCVIGHELYKHLQEILQKIIHQKEPEAV